MGLEGFLVSILGSSTMLCNILLWLPIVCKSYSTAATKNTHFNKERTSSIAVLNHLDSDEMIYLAHLPFPCKESVPCLR